MSNILSGIGRGQLEVNEGRVRGRRDNFTFYKNKLRQYEVIRFVEEPNKSFFSPRWLTTILIGPEKTGVTRGDLQTELEKKNIESRPLWKPMLLQPVFSSCPSYLSGVSEGLFQKGLCLLSGSNTSDEYLQRIISII